MKHRNRWLLAGVLGAALTTTSQAQSPALGSGPDVPIHDGFIRGTDVRSFDDKGRARYAAGVIDGMLMAPVFGAPQANVEVLENCVKSMNSSQLAGLLMKELDDHPSVRPESAHKTLYRALVAKCAK